MVAFSLWLTGFWQKGLDMLTCSSPPRAAEFFAGIGLVREGLKAEGFKVVFSNDVDATKRSVYVANHGTVEFSLRDVREITGDDVPDIELAAASFPCTDVSLAGARAGLDGKESGLVWEFQRILQEMGSRKPPVVVLENVPGLATSNNGHDLQAAIGNLNGIGYSCDIIVLDARRFVPQSRSRIFVVGWLSEPCGPQLYPVSEIRPALIARFVERNPQLSLQPLNLPPLPDCSHTIADIVENLPHDNHAWWDEERLGKFYNSLSPIQSARLARLRDSDGQRWATAYRRTRGGKAMWEIRGDDISGCLRTGKGGSSRQALVEAGQGGVKVRWMTAREYCRLQGAPDLNLAGITENQARFALGDAVCVPAISWLARNCLKPLVITLSNEKRQ